MSLEKVKDIEDKIISLNTSDLIKYVLKNHNNVALSSSLGAEDQVLTDMILKVDKNSRVFTLDTGRLHSETYKVLDETNLKYGVKIEVFFPKFEDVENLYKTQGVNGHFESIDNRKNCCNIRKIEPLKRGLKGVDIWITGLRASQSITRETMPIVEWDENFKVIKLNPLINWSEDDVWNYIKANKVPYNKLHDNGFPSIGCEPCTRAIKDGEDIRAGRWWWENEHLYEFNLGAPYASDSIGPEEADDGFAAFTGSRFKKYEAEKTYLSEFFNGQKKKMSYTYDFGDDWIHTITVLKKPNEEVLYPKHPGGLWLL